MAGTPRIAAAAAAALVGLLVAADPALAGWQVLHTPHLRVYFQPGHEPLAMDAARVGEQALEALQQELGYRPQEPVHLILDDRSDLANGFTDVTFHNRVVILPVFPVGMGYSTGLSPRMEDWLRLVVTHEMAHAVHLDMAEGPTVGFRALFGRVPLLSTPNLLQPRSWLEGIATFEETRLVEGGRGADPFFDMYLRAQVLSGTWPSMDQTLGLYDLERFQPAGTVYLYGYAWYDFLARRYGADAVRRIQQGFAGLRYALPGEAIRDVLQRPIGSVWDEMRQELEAAFGRQIRAIEAQGATHPHSLPSSGWVVTSPRVAPQGGQVAYAAQGPLVEDLRLLALDGGQDQQLVVAPVTAPGGLDWTPDGQRLVYAAVDVRTASSYADLFQMEVSTRRVRRLTRGLRAHAPAVSPDGSRVAFVSRRGLESQLMVMPIGAPQAAGGRPGPPEPAWRPPRGWQILSVAWRPGPYVAVSVWRPGGFTDLLLLDPAGEPGADGWPVVRQITSDRAVDDRPAWSPDGRHLLFHSDRDGIYNLYAYRLADGRAFRLTNVLTGAFDPTVTPDGQQVIFSWYQADGYRLARLDWEELRWEPVDLGPNQVQGQAQGQTDEAGGGAEQAAARGPDGPALPDGWHVTPYRAWETLRPAFWLPVSDSDWAGPQLSVITGGQDVLQGHQYALEAGIGLLSGEPRLYAGYLRSVRPEAGPYLLVEGESRPWLLTGDDGTYWYRVRQGRAAVLFPFGSYTRSGALELQFGTREQLRRAGRRGESVTPAATSEQRAGVSLSAAALAGDHRAASVTEAALSATAVLAQDGRPTDPVDFGSSVLQLAWRRFGPGNPGLSVQAAAGVSGQEFGHRYPFDVGVPGPFEVRAFERGRLQASGAAAAVRLELARRLRTVMWGLGDAPLFADSLDGVLFAEGAAGWDWQDGRLERRWQAAAVGAEVRLGLTLNYGTARVAVRLGFAQGLPPHEASRVYLAITLF